MRAGTVQPARGVSIGIRVEVRAVTCPSNSLKCAEKQHELVNIALVRHAFKLVNITHERVNFGETANSAHHFNAFHDVYSRKQLGDIIQTAGNWLELGHP